MRIAQATPEIPVKSVDEAQRYCRDRMGFRIEWTNEAGRIGAVSHGDCAIFFRATEADPQPAVFWIFTEDVDLAHSELAARGADIVDPVADKPWGCVSSPFAISTATCSTSITISEPRARGAPRPFSGTSPRDLRSGCLPGDRPPHATSRNLALNAARPAL